MAKIALIELPKPPAPPVPLPRTTTVADVTSDDVMPIWAVIREALALPALAATNHVVQFVLSATPSGKYRLSITWAPDA